MICRDCKDGAVLTTAARKYARAEPERAGGYLDQAKVLHGLCKGCTCGHRVPTLEQVTQ